MFRAPTKEDLPTFELSQREGEIQILRQRVSALTEDQKRLSAKLEREMLEGNRLREEVRRLTTPPQTSSSEDVWEDVTIACMIQLGHPSFGHGTILHCIGFTTIDVLSAEHDKDYRVRRVNDHRSLGPSFIVERKVS